MAGDGKGVSFFANAGVHLYTPGEGAIYLGLDERNREIGVTLERHALTIAGAGAGKGVGLVVPNGLRWADNLLIVEPKGESIAALWEAREAMGQKVVALDPFRITAIPERLRGSFNPLAAITPADIDGREHLQMIADGLVKRSDPRHEEWYAGAATILAGLLAFIVETAPPEHRNLTALRALLLQTKDELHADAQRMQSCTAFGRLARAAGIQIQTALETEKGMERDFLGAARRYTEWLDSDPIAATLKESSFDLSELKAGKISLFVIIPPQYLETHAAYLRLFVRASIEAMMKSGARGQGRCLFMLDEFYSLGRLDIVSKSAGLMRDYGLHLWPIMQDIDQLRSLYKDISETYFANADAVTFFGVTDQATLEYISRKVGIVTLDDIKARPPVRAQLVSDKLAQEAGSPVIPPRPIGAPPSRNPSTNTALFIGTGILNSLNQVAYELEAHQQAAKQVTVARLREQEQRMDEEAMREYQHELQRRGEPRLTPDGVAKLIGKGKNDKIARAMIAFLRGGDMLCIRPHPYFAPPPAELPHPSKFRAELLNDEIRQTGRELQNIYAEARAYDGKKNRRRLRGIASIIAGIAGLIFILENNMLPNFRFLPHYTQTFQVLGVLALMFSISGGLGYACHHIAHRMKVANFSKRAASTASRLMGLAERLLTETIYDIDPETWDAIPNQFKTVLQRQRENILGAKADAGIEFIEG
ncbi:type IV secretory system conjugative DNA transfer family protein [Chelatococcus sp. YT9]|uniref:type IV secretory system conjugative DNA transfer family protein n=1 Tax=Chelatococcus sp. YT9 TaxID=2835635 RepID=UPI001BCCB5F1|nr:type IV secretory system conjugative DNA transfer family protein [Chelatococcus sp. YT9]MBS7701666.1 type IV secretory system conjugative DNA transfer family protein [Chelatococcus sp. YT9]